MRVARRTLYEIPRTPGPSSRGGETDGGVRRGSRYVLALLPAQAFPRNRCLLEFAKGSGGSPYAFGEMAERAGILFEGLETRMGAQGKYVLYEKGSGGVGHSVGLSIDARGTCVLHDRNSPTE